MRSPRAYGLSAPPLRPLLAKELAEIVSGRALWTMLLLVCPLVGYSFVQAVSLYSEASAAALQSPVLATSLSPLDGILVPTFGSFYVAVTLLFPFVAHPRAWPGEGNGRAAPARPTAVSKLHARFRQARCGPCGVGFGQHSRAFRSRDLGHFGRPSCAVRDFKPSLWPSALRSAWWARLPCLRRRSLESRGHRRHYRACCYHWIVGAGFYARRQFRFCRHGLRSCR